MIFSINFKKILYNMKILNSELTKEKVL